MSEQGPNSKGLVKEAGPYYYKSNEMLQRDRSRWTSWKDYSLENNWINSKKV